MQQQPRLLFLLCILLGAATSAKPANTLPDGDAKGKYFEFSVVAKDIYNKVSSLRFSEAQASLALMQRNEPDNLMAIYLENYLDFFTIFINDDKNEYRRLAKNTEPRLEKIAKGPASSPWLLYTQAEIRLQWAITRSRYNDFLTTLSDIKQAYTLLEENQRKFPDFMPNKKSLGIMHALIGNVPEEFRWAVKTLGGMEGSTEQGMRELEEVLAYAKSRDFPFEDEAVVAYSFLQLYLNNQSEQAWQILKTSKLSPKTNPLAAYVIATVAMRNGQNDEAIKVLQQSPTGKQYASFHYRNYLLGLAQLRRLDADAHKALETFTNQFKGENGLKEAYQKLAWYHLVFDNEMGYRTYMNYAKLKGAASSESDKAALREANSGEMPDPRLLKARLLFDGGYYQRAYDLLKNNAADYASDRKKKLEYSYRLGRIAHKMGKTHEATQLYTQTIESGAKDPWYFACNAALQLGLLYEEIKDKANARAAFQRCLSIKPEEYAASLHAQAKAGLGRTK
ncbi:MAG: tetratricopeptide repeat protein [Saprospiraceae bacterium]|nr:tetratricopeptide repeat protein [Saprospiraceae bacterium]